VIFIENWKKNSYGYGKPSNSDSDVETDDWKSGNCHRIKERNSDLRQSVNSGIVLLIRL